MVVSVHLTLPAATVTAVCLLMGDAVLAAEGGGGGGHGEGGGEVEVEVGEIPETTTPQDGHLSGGLPMISDSAFSLVILVYVSVAFCFVFFMFCWKSEAGKNGKKGKPRRQCVLMTNEEQPDQQGHDTAATAAATAVANSLSGGNGSCCFLTVAEPLVIPPTPSPTSPSPMTKLVEEEEEGEDSGDSEEDSDEDEEEGLYKRY